MGNPFQRGRRVAALGNAGAAAFSPSDVAGLVEWHDSTIITKLWTDSARTVQVAADGDRVGAWDDKTASGFNLLQATAGMRGTYKTNIQNGLPVVRTDGVDDFLQHTASVAAQPLHIFMAAKGDGTAGVVWSDGGTGAGRVFIGNVFSGANFLELFATSHFGAAHTPSAFHIYHARANGASSFIRLDEAALASGDAGATGLSNGLTIGASFANTANSSCDFGEILVYNADVSDAGALLIQAYLKAKWGTP